MRSRLKTKFTHNIITNLPPSPPKSVPSPHRHSYQSESSIKKLITSVSEDNPMQNTRLSPVAKTRKSYGEFVLGLDKVQVVNTFDWVKIGQPNAYCVQLVKRRQKNRPILIPQKLSPSKMKGMDSFCNAATTLPTPKIRRSIKTSPSSLYKQTFKQLCWEDLQANLKSTTCKMTKIDRKNASLPYFNHKPRKDSISPSINSSYKMQQTDCRPWTQIQKQSMIEVQLLKSRHLKI